jgi:hypothetical protein
MDWKKFLVGLNFILFFIMLGFEIYYVPYYFWIYFIFSAIIVYTLSKDLRKHLTEKECDRLDTKYRYLLFQRTFIAIIKGNTSLRLMGINSFLLYVILYYYRIIFLPPYYWLICLVSIVLDLFLHDELVKIEKNQNS